MALTPAQCRAHACVVATLAGHAHGGGYHREANGLHHFVFPALLECAPGTTAYGHIDVYEEGFAVRGTGKLASTAFLPFREWNSAEHFEEGCAEPAAAADRSGRA
jgi:hypothetical protein